MTVQCNETRFLNDVKDHTLTVIKDDGVCRHIRLSKPGTSIYHFDLITWPGHLCITGDCGTYVFSRIQDMFDFFRTEKDYIKKHPDSLFINPGYWGEKLLSVGTNAGYKEFDPDKFRERVNEYIESWIDYNNLDEENEEDEEKINELRSEIESQVFFHIDDSSGNSAYNAINEFQYDGFVFEDFFDGGGTERYTFHYLWCLYAINWGISQYDSHVKEAS